MAVSRGDSVRDLTRRFTGSAGALARCFAYSFFARYVDQGYAECFMKDPRVAKMIQNVLLRDVGKIYKLFAWVVMPNHILMYRSK